MPTIIPFYFDEPNYEFEYIDENIYTNYMNEKEEFKIHDKNNNSNKELEYCFSLLNSIYTVFPSPSTA